MSFCCWAASAAHCGHCSLPDMSDQPAIRESCKADHSEIMALYPAAFPDEDLLPVLGELLADQTLGLSLVAVTGKNIIGHVFFTRCREPESFLQCMLLAPLAVCPEHQGRGIGSNLVTSGFEQLRENGIHRVFVLGDPNYYGRFGFTAESVVAPPYPLPAEWAGAWQSVWLDDPGLSSKAGVLNVPPAWQHRELWSA